MSVLQVIASVNPAGGGPIECVKLLSAALAEQGYETEVACLDRPDQPWVAQAPFQVHALGSVGSGYGYSPDWIPWIRQQSHRFQAVIVHGIWQYVSIGTWLALRNSQTPYFVYPHGMLDPWFKRTFPLKHLKKSLYWLVAEQWVMRDAKSVLFTCDQERILARQSFWPYRCREALAHLGISSPPGDPQAQKQLFWQSFPALQSQRLILFLGRIHPKKGCDLLIQAFAQVADGDPALHLVMAGPDQIGWQQELIAQAEALGISDRITWAGMLSGDLKWGAFRASEVFILPSHQENFGIAVVEALACGLPVLISRQINIWAEIEQAGSGLVAADTIEGTLQLLKRWLALSGSEQETMRQRAKHCFQTTFDIQVMVKDIVAILPPPST